MKNMGSHDGWAVGSPEQLGLSPDLIEAIGSRFQGWAGPNLHAVLIVRRGVLVYERYFTNEDTRWGEGRVGRVTYDASMRHELRSVTKSVISLVVGIAVGRGWIPGVDVPVVSFFPEYGNLGTDKRRITLRHLLTMSPGLEWDESAPPTTGRNSELNMAVAPDPYRYVLERPVIQQPGAVFKYCGGATQLLAGILRQATQASIKDRAKTDLFDPLGIADVQWMHYPNGEPSAAGGLRLRPRDLAKIGQLVLDRGAWRGTQIVPAAWIEESTRPHLKGWESRDYGYHWWCGRSQIDDREVGWTAGFGLGGQRLFVVPSQGLVVVVMAGAYDPDRFTSGTRSAIAGARHEARLLGRSSVRPEHLLLGVISHKPAVAGWVLAELGVTLEAARVTVGSRSGGSDDRGQDDEIPLSSATNSVVTQAWKEAGRLGHPYVGTEHLLLALLQLGKAKPGGPIQGVAQQFGLDAERVQALLLEELGLGRRLAAGAGTMDNSTQRGPDDGGSLVLNQFVLPAVRTQGELG